MFKFFRLIRKQPRRSPQRRETLYLELLEGRDCPTVTAVTLTVTPETGTTVDLSGHVTATDPSTVLITFSGVVNNSVTPDSSGDYDYEGSASSLGTVEASAQDSVDNSVATAEGEVSSVPPSISDLSVSHSSGTTVTVSGQVFDASPGTVSVNFSGVVFGSTTTNSDGTFSANLTASALGDIQAVATDAWGLTSASAQVNFTSAAPLIETLSVSSGTGSTVTVSGQVSDANPGSVGLTFSGVASGSTTTNSDGTFSANLTASALGNIQAVATNFWGLTSDPASVAVSSVPPSIGNLSVSYSSGTTVTVSGQVSDADPSSATVSFSGVVSGSIIPNSDGTFSADLAASALGNIQAVATNAWGLSSDPAETAFTSAAPSFDNLIVTFGSGSMITVSGQIADANPGSVPLVFSGVVSGATMTNSDGTFSVDLLSSGFAPIQVVATDSWGLSAESAFLDGIHVPPAIDSLSISHDTGTTVTVSGQISDANPSTVVVIFSGAASGFVTANSDGTFSEQMQASDLGPIQAMATDSAGLASDPDTVAVTSMAPSVQNLAVSYGSGTTVTLTGNVTDANPETVTVQFSGVASGSVTPNADGSFSVNLQASEVGTIQAVATNDWGLTSDPETVDVTTETPSIQDLSISYGTGTTVTISGQLIDASPGTATVHLSGMASGSATPNADGTFSVTVCACALGNIQAVATNAWGLTSAAASVTVASNPPSFNTFVAALTSGTLWSLSGSITDECPQGLTVSFGGLAALSSVTATVQADATFGATATIPADGEGLALAYVTDCWGLRATPAEYLVCS